jgi:hypothetical protein
VDFLGTHMISLVLFFRKSGVTPPFLTARRPLSFPRFPPGPSVASPASRLARERAPRLPLSAIADTAGPRVGRLLLLHADVEFLFLVHHRPNPRLNLLLSFLGTAYGLYKPTRALLRIHLALLKLPWCSRNWSPRAATLAAASPSHATPLVRLRLRFCPK